MRRLALSLLLAASPALAQNTPPAGERLVLNPPDNWQAVSVQRGEKVNITRLFPPGQNDKQWSEMVTLQIYNNSDKSPRSFIEDVVAYSRDNCEAAGPSPVTEAPTNGYPMARVAVSCSKGRASGHGGYVIVQAMRGREALYVVQRHWRGAPFDKNHPPAFPPEMLREWGAFLSSISLCDTRDTRHPCPKE